MAVERLSLPLLTLAKIGVPFYGLGSVVLLLLSCFWPFWGYVVGSCAQTLPSFMAIIPLNVLYFQPLPHCAGMAAAFDSFAQGSFAAIVAAGSTQVFIKCGLAGLGILQGAVGIASAVIFGFTYFGSAPPDTAKILETAPTLHGNEKLAS